MQMHMGSDGAIHISGPIGVSGDVGPRGATGKSCTFWYRGLSFFVELGQEEYETFYTDGVLSQADLDFMRVVNPTVYTKVRETWKKAYINNLADEVFENGNPW